MCRFYEDNYYPQNVVDINGKPMIEHVIENYAMLEDVRYTVCLFREECDKFHTDKIVSVLTGGNCNIIKQENMTGGALCTALLTVDYVGTDDELIITNSDQIITMGINEAVASFRKESRDCGVITFKSVHPRWSYARVDSENNVVEVAEKHPLSNHAIAGFYYFAHGSDFIEAAKDSLRKRETYEGRYFISSAINEIILENKSVGYYEIPVENYRSFYSPEKIAEFHRGLGTK